MKKIVKKLILMCIFIVAIYGLNTNNIDQKQIKQVISESNDNYYVEEGEQIIEYIDGSYSVIDIEGNIIE